MLILIIMVGWVWGLDIYGSGCVDFDNSGLVGMSGFDNYRLGMTILIIPGWWVCRILIIRGGSVC